MLAIPNPDAGRGHAYFLRKEVAAEIRLPTCRMPRKESQRRIKAVRQKRWAAYRLAKETALGRSRRRVRAN